MASMMRCLHAVVVREAKFAFSEGARVATLWAPVGETMLVQSLHGDLEAPDHRWLVLSPFMWRQGTTQLVLLVEERFWGHRELHN